MAQQAAETIQRIATREAPHQLDSGIVRAVRGRYLDVVLDGTKKQVKDVICAEGVDNIEVGHWVVIVRVPRTQHWVAITSVEDFSAGTRSVTTGIATPSNLTVTAKPYWIHVSWDGSFRDIACFELQHNSSASATGATTVKVQGSTFVYFCDQGTTRYFRVRAVDQSFERTNWTSWSNATTPTGEAYMYVGLNVDGSTVEWQAWDWDLISAVTGADMAHNHHSATEGDAELWPDRLGVGTASIPAMDGVIGVAEVAGRPPFAPNEGRYYCKDVSGVAEAFYEDDQGREIQLTDDGSAVGGGGGGGAPTNAQYLTLAVDDTLSDERVLTPGSGLSGTDGGAGSTYTLSVDTDVPLDFQATAQSSPDMTVSVAAGRGRIGGTVYESTAQNSPAASAPTANPYIAYLYARRDTSSSPDGITLFWVYGEETAAPDEDYEPDVADALLICKVYIRVGATSIKNTDDSSNGYILRDTRPILDQHRKWALFDESSKIRTIRLPLGTVTKDTGNPIIEGQGAGWEADVIFGSVIQSPLDGIWYLYYAGVGAGAEIGVCTAPSPDGPWTRYAGNPILSVGVGGTWDDDRLGLPVVIYDPIDGDFKMWYYGYDGATPDCGLATANDPLGAWSKDAGNPIGLTNFGNANSCLRIGNIYVMAFATTGNVIQVCDSANGTTFTNYQTIISPGAGGTWDDTSVRYCAFYFNQGTFYVLYSGYDGTNYRIGLASQAGQYGGTYTKFPRNPTIGLGAGASWESDYVFNPGIVMHRETYHIWYTGVDAGGDYAIGHATIP